MIQSDRIFKLNNLISVAKNAVYIYMIYKRNFLGFIQKLSCMEACNKKKLSESQLGKIQ